MKSSVRLIEPNMMHSGDEDDESRLADRFGSVRSSRTFYKKNTKIRLSSVRFDAKFALTLIVLL